MPIEYTHMEEDGDPVECTACAFPAPLHEFRWPAFMKQDPGSKLLLCALCASSPVGNVPQYPDEFRSDGRILITINHAANAILEALGAFRVKP